MKSTLPLDTSLGSPPTNNWKFGKPESPGNSSGPIKRVTVRAFMLGLSLTIGLAALNAWIETVANVHFLGGVQLPPGAIFGLLALVLFVNIPLRWLRSKVPLLNRYFTPFSPFELLTIYVMLFFAATVSTVGTDNFFLTTGPALFYYSTRENGWANLFYDHVPSWFAPGWNGTTYQHNVIEPLYVGGLNFAQIPWHAWAMMLVAWTIFLLLVYATLFFVALLLRKQWIQNEALSFPLVQIPLKMVEVDEGQMHPPGQAFWTNRALWIGFSVAAFFHGLRGLNNYYPDWPMISSFQGNSFSLGFSDLPYSAMGKIGFEVFLGAIGIAYLLTREVSFSFWFFFLFTKLQLLIATQSGFPVGALPKDSYVGAPTFLTFQSVGGWFTLGGLLLWTARGHLKTMALDAWHGVAQPDEPFSPRVACLGFCLSFVSLLTWSWFAGINPLLAVAFFGVYVLISVVLARLVIEGGFLFPQFTFSPLEWMTGSVFGASAMGAANLTQLTFFQTMLMNDARTNVLPGFLHALKIAHEQKVDRRGTQQLMGAAFLAIGVALGVTIVVALTSLYSVGGLSCYGWFASGAKGVFEGTANVIAKKPAVDSQNWLWMGAGALSILIMSVMRARFPWFALHPIGYVVATGYPISRLWLSFFLGWFIKSQMIRYSTRDAQNTVQTFMIGLILGNASSMVLWMIFGFFKGVQISYWPA